MNLFALHPDPRVCAESLDDSRVSKMTLETAQMICTALRKRGERDLPYRSSHENHPVTKWVCADDRNLYWTIKHHQALAREHQMRTGNVHKSWQDVGKRYIDIIPKQRTPQTFQNSARRESLGLDFTWVGDVHLAYRMYLRARWLLAKPVWTERGEPYWFDEDLPFTAQSPEGSLLMSRARMIAKGKTGTAPCPRCSREMSWKTIDGLKTLKCKTDDCLYFMEV